MGLFENEALRRCPTAMSAKTPSQSIVRIYLNRQGYFQGIVTSMSTCSLTVDFPLDEVPELNSNSTIELALSSDRLKSSLRLPALPKSFRDEKNRRRYTFEIDVEAQMALKALVDGRNECRVSPDVNNPIHVLMRQPQRDALIDGSLDDVSRTGLSALVRPEYADVLSKDELTSISFLIPGERTPLQLGGFFRHAEIFEGQCRIGFEFTPSANECNESDLIRFRWYVESLKDELLSHLRACGSLMD